MDYQNCLITDLRTYFKTLIPQIQGINVEAKKKKKKKNSMYKMWDCSVVMLLHKYTLVKIIIDTFET
jgi:hypothetical protein